MAANRIPSPLSSFSTVLELESQLGPGTKVLEVQLQSGNWTSQVDGWGFPVVSKDHVSESLFHGLQVLNVCT